jgi:hypothetical protein
MGLGGEAVREVAQGMLDGAKGLVVGEIDEFIGQAFEEAVRRAAEGFAEVAAAFFTPLGCLRSGKGGCDLFV